jgi:hypothetical protein
MEEKLKIIESILLAAKGRSNMIKDHHEDYGSTKSKIMHYTSHSEEMINYYLELATKANLLSFDAGSGRYRIMSKGERYILLRNNIGFE